MTFYAYNIAVKGRTQAEVANYMKSLGEAGIVTPTENGTMVFSSEECSMKDRIERLAKSISQEFDCPALAMHNYDDAILWLQLHVSGEIADEYDSCPSYFDFGFQDNPPKGPEGGDAWALCMTWGTNAAWAPLIEGILRSSSAPGRDVPDFEAKMKDFLRDAGEHATFPSNMPTGMHSDILDQLNRLAEGAFSQPKPNNGESPFARAFQSLSSDMQEGFMAKFQEACIHAGVGDHAAASSLRSGFTDERERHAALAAALGLPLYVASLCGTDEEDLIPEGTIILDDMEE